MLQEKSTLSYSILENKYIYINKINASIKICIYNFLGFKNNMLSVAMIQLCHCNGKAALDSKKQINVTMFQ